MPLPAAAPLPLGTSERRALLDLIRHRSTPQSIVLRVQIVLGAGDGVANRQLARSLQISVPTVLLWRSRYQAEGFGPPAKRPLEQRWTSGGRAPKSSRVRRSFSRAKTIWFWRIRCLAERWTAISRKRRLSSPEGLVGGVIPTLEGRHFLRLVPAPPVTGPRQRRHRFWRNGSSNLSSAR